MRKKTAFITGIAGFVGSYLAEELIKNKFDVHGSYLPSEPLGSIEHFKKNLKLYKLDILKPNDCKKIFTKVKPDYVFHLAGYTSVSLSFRHEKECYDVNIEGTTNVLEACKNLKNLKKIIFSSSSEVYGKTANKYNSLKETHPTEPNSPYAVSKLHAENICLHYYHRFHVPIVISRSFNHTGPKQSTNFAIPSFSKQIALIEAGKQEPVIHVGNLLNFRDFSDVRDIVIGYHNMALKGRSGEIYNLCSGKSVQIKSALKTLLKMSKVKITIKKDIEKYRKSDIPQLKGSKVKAVKELGYISRYTLKNTLEDSLNYWRTKIAGL